MTTQASLPGLGVAEFSPTEETEQKLDATDSYHSSALEVSSPSHIGDTTVTYAPAREVLTKAIGFMEAYDFTLNPYSGCSFGCTYCYAAFFSRNADKMNNWGKWVNVKDNAVELLRNRRRSLDGKLIYMSSVTDPYQPVERQLELTRGLLQAVVDRQDKPKLVIQTRSPDAVRDCDLFQRIEYNGGRVQVNMTVTTDDEDIRCIFEPHCPSNPRRLEAIGMVQGAGITACITMTPLLLISSPYAFADSLLDTGVQKFIAQSFHFKRGKFLAGTRDGAFDLMTEKLGCSRASFHDEYLDHYRMVFDVLRDTLPELGEGKSGFEPPF